MVVFFLLKFTIFEKNIVLKIKFIIILLVLFYSCNKNNNDNNLIVNKKINIDSVIKLSSDKKISLLQKKSLISDTYLVYKLKPNSKLVRDDFAKIIFEFFYLNDWDKLNDASTRLFKMSSVSNDSVNLGVALRFKGFYFKNEKVFDSSFYYYLKAEKLYLKRNDMQNYANVLLNKGIVQYNVGDYLGSELTLSKAYNIFKNSDDKRRLYDVLNALGNVSDELKDHDKAIFYYNDALNLIINKRDDSEHHKSILFNNIGFTYQNIGKHDLAIKNFQSGLNDDNLKNDFPELYANLTDNLAYSKFKTNENKLLPKLFFDALKVRENLNNKVSIVLSKIHLSEFYFSQKDTLESKKYAKQAYELSLTSKAPSAIMISLKQLSNVDRQNSSIYTERYIKINDSLQIVERNSKDRFTRFQLETDELKKENLVLEERNRDVLNFLFGTILFVGFLYYMRVQRSKERELALKQAHQKANEEIYRLIISHQNQLEEGRDLEKKRLSKELHDGVLGRLFGLRLNLDGLNSFDDPDSKQQRLDYLNELKIIEQDLREISHELSRENLVLINNFVAILNRLVEEQAKVNTAKIKMVIADDIQWDKVSNIIKINLYRILQEALQNINKHAQAKNISIHFRTDKKGNLLFDIEDDGIGYDTTDKKKKGIGTKNIVERTQQCNGFIDIKSEVGVGSKIIITFPVDSKTIKI